MKIKKNRIGISLILLVITIIIMIVLAGAVILALSNSGIIGKANMGRAKSDLSTLMEEVQVKAAERKLDNLDTEGKYKLSDWGIQNSTYEDRTMIVGGKLRVLNKGKDDDVEKAAKELDIIINTASAVLENTTGSSLLNYKIYGNSIQEKQNGKNHIEFPYYNKNNVEDTGLTFVQNDDNTITINGTSTKSITYYLNSGLKLSNNKYFLSGLPSGLTGIILTASARDESGNTLLYVRDTGEGTVFDVTNVKFWGVTIAIRIDAGVTLNNVTIKPQLEVGSTSTEYEKYIQSPTPNNPVKVQSLGDLVTDTNDANYGKYKIPVRITGKNLFDEASISGDVVANGTAEKINNGWRVKGNFGGEGFAHRYSSGWFRPGVSKGSIFIAAGSNVTISADVKLVEHSSNYTNNNNVCIFMYSNRGASRKSNVDYAKASVSDLEKDKIVRVKQSYNINVSGYYYPVFTIQNNELEITNIQVQISDDDISYEPYKELFTNIYLNEPLRKLGEYSDYIDFEEKKVVREIGVDKIGDLTNVEYHASAMPTYPYGFFVAYTTKARKTGEKLLSSAYVSKANFNIDKVAFGNAKGKNIYFVDKDYTDASTFIKALQNEEVQYILENPIEESITLPNIPTFKGTTVISIVGVNGVEASNIVAEY